MGLEATSCNRNTWLDAAMSDVPHHRKGPAKAPSSRVGPYEVLAGDLHCHVQPPDSASHVSRELPETAELAAAEGLDFVVLTPHVPGRFFLDPEKREWVRGTQSVLRAQIDAFRRASETSQPAAAEPDVLMIPGMEYTDHRFGHVGLSFANVEEVLDDLPVLGLAMDPEVFFERWRAHGGIAILNHPTVRPIAHAPVAELRGDLSWRGFARAGAPPPPEVARYPEIAWLSEHADAIETYNLGIGHLRDQFFLGDEDWTLRQNAHLLERQARAGQRRITAAGGSDSHGAWLRPTTWVLATERTTAAIRDAILAGRTCVRGPEACSFEVRGADGAFHVVGAAITSSGERIEARAEGEATYWVNGVRAASGRPGELVDVPVPDRCALVRVVVGRSWSGPVYVNCPWAEPATHHG
jgi:hypothetical protein